MELLSKKWVWWVLMVIAIICLSLVVISRFHKPVKVVPDRKATVTDSTTTAIQQKKIAELDSILKLKNNQLATSQISLSIVRGKNMKLKQTNDSLSAYYNCHHTLPVCDSLVKAKQTYITGLESENDSLYSVTRQLNGLVNIERQKSARLDTIVNSKESVITAYARQMERINCTSEWAIKHRFWAWLFRIKCYK
ncbi:MAG: hypothetical protein H6Q17_580 [Bacteroidetes bacterium]|nr:hypothetical protein [Bacteroidota bacterium]